jgi:hypothetical protein
MTQKNADYGVGAMTKIAQKLGRRRCTSRLRAAENYFKAQSLYSTELQLARDAIR